jgi:hypothetical protein
MPYDYSFVLEKDILKKSWNMFDMTVAMETIACWCEIFHFWIIYQFSAESIKLRCTYI